MTTVYTYAILCMNQWYILITNRKKRKEGKTMYIEGNTNTKNILTAAGKNTFRLIRSRCGIDFEKPVFMYEGFESFTINKIMSIVPDKNYTIVILVNGSEYWKNRYFIVKIENERFSIDIDIRRFDNVPDYYHTKGGFEESRKKTNHYFIIAQDKKFALPVQDDIYHFDFVYGDRYIITKSYGSNNIYFKDIFHDGKVQYYSTNSYLYHGKDDIENPVNWFDKSGYYTLNVKRNRIQKARKLKTERQKAAYILTDNTDKVKEVKEKAQQAKREMINRLENSQDYETASKTIDILYYDFRWILFEIDLYEKRTINKEYSSIDNSEKAYTNIISKFEKLYEKLNGKDDNQ